MTNTTAVEIDVNPEDFVPVEALTELMPVTFPSKNSVEWFIRQNRNLLAQRNALLTFRRRLRVHPQKIRQAVIDTGLIRSGNNIEETAPQT